MPSQTDVDTALAAVAKGATLVTGSARLARRALGDEAAARVATGERVWRRGDVLSWSAWLKRLHTDALAGGAIAASEPATLLAPAQAAALWQRLIDADPVEHGLLQPAVAARQALAAHALCVAWRIDREELRAGHHHEDVAGFLRWSAAFDRELRARRWLVPAMLPDCAAQWLERVPALRPCALYLAGFEELTPQQRMLIAALERLGVGVHEVVARRAAAADAVRIGCVDPEGEIIAAAHWARRRLESDPRARIAIVVRDLGERRAALARHLDAVLDPAATRSGAARLRRPWNIALGWPLAEEPLIHDALLLLAAAGGHLDFAAASRLLRSPFIAGAESERGARLRVERALRDGGDPELQTPRLARLARAPLRRVSSGESGEPRCPELATRLDGVLDAAERGNARRSPGAWAEHFAALLKLAGWPGERGLDSREYQALAAWQELLGEFAALGTVLPVLDRRGALGRLRRLAAERVFQPRSRPAPVQVLGLLDALGQRFDALWVMGLDDEAWPATPRPNPFLPARLQRDRGLPHASAARELQFAEHVGAELLAAAPQVVASWPRRSGDRNLRPSPLIAALPEREVEPPLFADPRDALRASARFETFDEVRGPPLRSGSRARGGAGLFRDQSQCPFRAFAVHRLKADALASPVAGLSALDRGSLVHDVLEALWKRLSTRAALAALNRAQRAELVNEVVDRQIERAASTRPAVFTQRFADVERTRLRALMHEWLECELAREDFRVIEREASVEISVAAPVIDPAAIGSAATVATVTGDTSTTERTLTVRGRIDRIDELPDGRRILIDYKTGKADTGRWLGERPEEPQLPLYSGLYGDTLAGVVFGQVRTRQCAWRGVTRDDTQLPGAVAAGRWRQTDAADWPALRAQWRATLERLAGAIADGRAEVDPLNHQDTCKYCHVAALCRIDELRGGFARDPDAEPEPDDDD